MNEVTETIEDSVETAEENLTAVDALVTLAASALVGAAVAVGVPRLYRRIKNRKNVSLDVIEATSREV